MSRNRRTTLLFFAYHFPPENVIGAARPFRFYKYLTRLGYDCRVITAAPPGATHDPNVEYVPDPLLSPNDTWFGRKLEHAARKFFAPGALGIRWSRAASRAALRFVHSRPDHRFAVFSTFPPLGSHLAALRLVRRHRVPWLADFRDPLADKAKQPDLLPRRWAARLERTIMQRADILIANTDGIEQRWKGEYPYASEKIRLIWNGFDPEDDVGPSPIPQRPSRIISHVGELYAGRNPAPILESLERLVARGALRPGAVQFQFIGPAEAGARPNGLFARGEQQGWLKLILEQRSQQEARRIAQESDGLLLLQPGTAVQVPAKLFEYVRIGRPILAYLLPDSTTERLLERSGIPYRVVYKDSPAEIIDSTLGDYLDLLATAPATPSSWFYNNFDATKQTEFLASLIDALR